MTDQRERPAGYVLGQRRILDTPDREAEAARRWAKVRAFALKPGGKY